MDSASGRPRNRTLFLATLPLVCVDIDAASAAPIGVSIPRQPFLGQGIVAKRKIAKGALVEHDPGRPTAPTPAQLRATLGEGRWGQPDAWNLPFADYFPSHGGYRGAAKVKDLVLFLHEAVLPRLPPGAKGADFKGRLVQANLVLRERNPVRLDGRERVHGLVHVRVQLV